MKQKILFKLLVVVFLSAASFAQTLMPLPPQTATFTGNTRGFWFTAPTDFMIVGLRVPTDASTANQHIQVVKLNANPPLFPSVTNSFTTLALHQNVAGTAIIPESIPVYAGDVIGIFGVRGTSNSYGTNNFVTSIFGQSVTLTRLGFQDQLQSISAYDIWTEAGGSITRVEMYYSTLINDDYPYCEGFEDGEGSWSETGIQSSWEYGSPAGSAISNAASGASAWVTNLDGDHNNDEFSELTSPEFDLTTLIDPTIRFSINTELQSGNDGVAFQISTDNGVNWSTLGSSSSPSPWYNSNNISTLNFYGNSNGWTGNTNGWTEMMHSLLGYVNDTSVYFRFVLASNGSVTNEGFGIDDIVIAESDDIEYVELIAPDSSCGASATTVSAYLCNKSVIPQTGFSVVLDTGGTNITVNVTDTIPVCGCDTFDLMTVNTSSGANWNMSSWVVNSGDVNSNNDSAFTDALIFPIPTGDVTGAGDYCQGDVAQLTFTFNGTQPFNLSFTDGSNGTFIPNIDSTAFVYTTFTGGNFEIIALSDASGCPGDTGGFGGVATITFNPAPPLDLGPDSTVCSGYQLDAGSGMASYAWNTGATSQTITPNQSGTFTVTITDNIGCDNTDEIDLEVNPSPVVNLDDTVLCEGASFTFNAGGGYSSYLWDDGSTGQVRIVNTVTTVFVTVTDFEGCEGTATASITAVVPNPSPNVQNQSGLAPITLDAGAGYASYQWVTGATTQTIDVFNSGTYTVTVTDDSGCEGEDAGNASIWPNGIPEVEIGQDGIGVYPVPADDRLNIVLVDPSLNTILVELLDVNGRIVSNQLVQSSDKHLFQLNISEELGAGTYLLKVKSNDQKLLGTRSVVIN